MTPIPSHLVFPLTVEELRGADKLPVVGRAVIVPDAKKERA